jgi:hypothetical protein
MFPLILQQTLKLFLHHAIVIVLLNREVQAYLWGADFVPFAHTSSKGIAGSCGGSV